MAGLSGFALYMLVFNKGSMLLNATTSCIIISTSPIITALLARIGFGEKPGARGWAATGLAFGGVYIMTL